jgi:AcrR family transcriptional regulator
LREEILLAAEQLLIETHDQSALSIRAIAAAVGVTPPSIYLHFADRADLLFAVCERHAEQLQHAMAEATAGVGDPVERIRRRGQAYVRWALENPEHYRILTMTHPDGTPDRFTDEHLADTAGLIALVEDLAAAMATGQIAGEDPLESAKLLWMVVHGMVSLLITRPEFPFPPVERTYDRLFEMVLMGMAPRT